MRRKAFWGEQGLIKRPISGVNNGELLDMEISMFGIRFYDRVKSQALRWLPWAELHRLAQQNPQDPLEQLGAAVAERNEPRILPVEVEIISFSGRKFVRTGERRDFIEDGQWYLGETNGRPIQCCGSFTFVEGRELLREIVEEK